MTIYCPAKVNLFLSVGHPDPSGYHPVRTVFQAIGLYDILDIERGVADEIVCDWPELPIDNTITKVLRLIREIVSVPPLHIRLEKRIPSQAGLGGGSSNAAGLIRAVKNMYAETMTDQFARDLAVAVGSDVPFFLVGGRARATGYGEIVEPLPDVEQSWLLVLKPEASVSTASAYKRLDAAPREWRGFSDDLYNDFERVAPCACSELSERLMNHGASGSLLSGSGSAVFGIFSSEAAANRAQAQMRLEGQMESWVTRTLTREESLWTS